MKYIRLPIFLLLAVLAAAALLLLSGREEPVPHTPPALTIASGEEEAAAWRGSYQWSWTEGTDTRSAIADSPHPLDVLAQLPTVHAASGEELTLAFDAVPDKAELLCYRTDGTDLTVCVVGDLSSGSRLTLPEDCADTLWVVEARWETGAATGRAQYAFRIA